MTDEEKAELQKAINDSGFPLQLGLKLLTPPRWRVALSEHPWRDPYGEGPKFIDFVLREKDVTPQRLVVECKRARGTHWIFLPDGTHTSRWETQIRVRARINSRLPKREPTIDDWADVDFIPGSPEVSHCVIRKNNQFSQELLEKTAAEVVRSVDALSQQELEIYTRTTAQVVSLNFGFSRVYIPIIATTARLFICDADYQSLDLHAGEVAKLNDVKEVPYVRFTKAFDMVDAGRSTARTISEFADASVRTVIVVQAKDFCSLVSRWDVGNIRQPIMVESFFPDGS